MRNRLLLVIGGFCLCFVARADAQFDDPFGVDVSLERSGESGAELLVNVVIPAKHVLYADAFSVSIDSGTLDPVQVPAPIAKKDTFSGEMVDVYAKDSVFRYRVDDFDDAVVTVKYMGCDDQLCFMPQTRTFPLSMQDDGTLPDRERSDDAANTTVFDGFRLVGRSAGYMPADEFLAFIKRVESGQGLEQGRLEALVASNGIWIGILAILLGGIALNLTPCVLPMIPVNLAIIGAGSQSGSHLRGFLLGGVYGAGIAFVYGVLGVVVVLTGAQFGQLNASPWFNLGIAVLFVALALAMMGMFNIDFSRFQSAGMGTSSRGSFLTAFFFGGVSALLAGACVAPVVISVLVLATGFYQRGNQWALLLPFVLGIGMALPWPFAGGGLSLLPKPGRWMERVKIGFGIVILLAAVYYGVLGASLLRAQSGVSTPVETAVSDRFWETSPMVAISEARRLKQPLFVDFWASWCKNCKAMDASTFKDASVREALGSYVRLKYQAEDPRAPETKRVLDLLGVKGLPTYVVLEVDE
jgi:thiol:disulfide interchange protein DsbD